MKPFGHIVSDTSSTVMSWCLEAEAAEEAVNARADGIAPRTALEEEEEEARMSWRRAGIIVIRGLLLDGEVHVLVRVAGRQGKPVHGLAEAHHHLVGRDLR